MLQNRTISAAHWLTAQRARTYAAMLAAAMLAFVAGILGLTALHTIADPAAKPLGLDFDAFWAAAHLAAAGHPALAYAHQVNEAPARAATPLPPGDLAFYYPPTFLLLLTPLGTLGYGAALAIFLATETILCLALLRRILPQRWAWLPLLGFPGFLMNALSGQNAALSASCFAAAAIWLETRPILAGAALGCLACKPQLAVCVPVALLAARRLRALAACAASAVTLAALSWLAFGTATWHGFLANAGNARADIETIAIKWPRMQSAFGALRLAGLPNTPAYAVQCLTSAAAIALLAWTASRRPGARLEAAGMATAALLFTPFLYDYDLALLCVPLACLLALAQPNGWRPWEKLLLTALYLLPLVARASGLLLGVTIGPVLVASLLVLLAKRASEASGSFLKKRTRKRLLSSGVPG